MVFCVDEQLETNMHFAVLAMKGGEKCRLTDVMSDWGLE